MEKYGVQTDETKIASCGCPCCGSSTENHGPVTLCKKCGSEPFEGGNPPQTTPPNTGKERLLDED